jgi:hypothetical protein
MIHISIKFGQIIFSGSEVTVGQTKSVTYVRTDRRTDVTEPNTIAPPFGAGANYNIIIQLSRQFGTALLCFKMHAV